MLGSLDGGELATPRGAPFRQRARPRRRLAALVDERNLTRAIEAGFRSLGGHEPSTSVGVDTWGCDYGLVDRRGQLLEPPYHYRDHRTDGVMARVLDRVGTRSGVWHDRHSVSAVQHAVPAGRARANRARRSLRRRASSAHHPRPHQPPADRPHGLRSSPTRRRRNAWTLGRAGGRRTCSSDLDLPRHLFGEIVRAGHGAWSADDRRARRDSAVPSWSRPPVTIPARRSPRSRPAATRHF